MPERILVVDDEPVILALVGNLLEMSGYEVVRASDGEQALTLAATPPPFDLIVSDVVLPGIRGPELVASLRHTVPGTAAILMSGYSDIDLPPNIPFLSKPFPGAELIAKAKQVLTDSRRARQTLGSEIEITHQLCDQEGIVRDIKVMVADKIAKDAKSRAEVRELTPREIDVLRLMSEGLSTKQIGAKLGVSFKTAASHRAHILSKIGVHETVSAMRWAIRAGIVKP
jgi:DNA-binding NarL/FixJ family response regulator